MKYLVEIQKSIDYIESNLEENIHYEDIAKHVGISSFYFHRIFSAIIGVSPAEYIRNRRLTCAADELTRNKANILDIAIKYQFGSNESFTRAFTKFHGISPKKAKIQGNELKSFAKVKVSLTIEGGNTMDYRIENRDAFKVEVIMRKFNLQTSEQEIPQFWTEMKQNGTLKKLSQNYEKKTLGICLGENGAEEFSYGIGVENEKQQLEDSNVVQIPASTWVIFRCEGQNPKDINQLWKRIYKEYFVTSEYQQSLDLDFELYDNKDMEIWIPISK